MIKILLRLILSQFKIFFREPGIVFWSFGFPLLMAWILGIAFANKGRAVHIVAVVDESPDAIYGLPEWLLEKTGAYSTKFSTESKLDWQVGENDGEQARFRFKSMNEDDATRALKRGKISLWLMGNTAAGIKYHFDPDNTESSLTFLLLERVLVYRVLQNDIQKYSL